MAMDPIAFEREPIFWTTTRPNYNDADRERVIEVDGELVRERVPQTGHQGDYENRQPARGRRWLPFVRHEGHRVAFVLTNAAAHMDTSTPYAQNELAMARFRGWYWIGSCPVAMLTTGELIPPHIVDKSLIKATPCAAGTYSEDKPCPHALAEEKARKAKNAKLELAREKAYKDPTDRQIEAAREENAKLIAALIESRGKVEK